MKQKILSILILFVFLTVPFLNVRSVIIGETPEELVQEVFRERTNLTGSKDMNEFILNESGIKGSYSELFINSNEAKENLSSLRNWVYGPAEGFGEFDIVRLIPLIRVYRIDTVDNTSVGYVEQFFMYKVKPGKNAKKTTRYIPEDWAVPVDENGAWTAATVDYYTVIMKKTEDVWKVEKLIDADIGGTEYSLKVGLLFAGCGIDGFPNPPTERQPLPKEINEELVKSSMGYKENNNTDSTTQSPYRRTSANYADTYWDNYNSSYATFENDCADFVSQCLYEGGRWSMDWNNNGVPESPNPPDYPSQEWHIKKGTLNSSWSWCRADNLDYYILNNIDYKSGVTISPYGWNKTYSDSALGDVITLDKTKDGTADHVGIVTAFEYYTGTPLVDAHNNNRYHTCWAEAPILHCWRMDYELDCFGSGY